MISHPRWIDVNDALYKKELAPDGDIVIHMKVGTKLTKLLFEILRILEYTQFSVCSSEKGIMG